MSPPRPIPITIVTGFLGAGKTTLILNLLPQLRRVNPQYRLALLKNEFGNVAVDSQLAASSAVTGVRELLGGCICCNLVGQLGDALRELREGTVQAEGGGPSDSSATTEGVAPSGETSLPQPQRNNPPPDRIVIETSGSAFPATLAMEVNRLGRATGGAYTLDGVVSVIDVENWRGYEDTSYTARLQARYTDLVIFNKWELCDERRFDDCLDRLGDLELDVAWVKSDRGCVPVDVVFGIDGALARSLEWSGTGAHELRHEDGGEKHKHDHQAEVEVLSVELRGPSGSAVDADKLHRLLKTAPKEEVYRIKAVLTASSALRGSDDEGLASALPTPPHEKGRYILNWAFGRWTCTPIDDSFDEHESTGQVTLRMTVILARYESAKWKTKLETAGLLELHGDDKTANLTVTKIA